MLKELVELGDILIFKSGDACIYVKCPEVRFDENKGILLRESGRYYGLGLEGFDENLYHSGTGDQVIEIYRPTSPVRYTPTRGFFLSLFHIEDFVHGAEKIFPDNTFINISLYV